MASWHVLCNTGSVMYSLTTVEVVSNIIYFN